MRLFRFYQYVNILSFDVVAGAVIGALFFGRILGVAISWPELAVLALTVWIIYTLDHLRDATFISDVASTDRHRFHQKYFRRIAATLLVAILTDLLLLWFIPFSVLMWGLCLWFFVVLYLVLERYLKFMKEFFVACLYTAGLLLPSLAGEGGEWLVLHSVVAGKYFVTAWMNLLLFSLIEYNEDRRHQQYSFVTWFGPASTHYGILVLALINVSGGVMVWTFDFHLALTFISMNVLLVAILLLQKHLRRHNAYRIAGDAIFFIPLFYLL